MTVLKSQLTPEQWEQHRARRHMRDALIARHPKQWVALISALAPELHHAVACVVWWDFFGLRQSEQAWPHLDKWVDRRPPAHDEAPQPEPETRAVCAALISIGYYPSIAAERVRPRSNAGTVYGRDRQKAFA